MNRRKPASSFSYQILESRNLLAGNVLVSLNGNQLEVRGDELGNEIFIFGTGIDNRVTVSTTQGTTINGGTSPFQVNGGLRLIDVQMGAGDDDVSITGLVIASNLNADGGEGNDRFLFRDIEVQNFIFDSGAGNDVLEFHNVFSRRDVQINGQIGDDLIAISALAAMRNLQIDSGLGSDTVGIDNFGVSKTVDIQTGEGDDLLMMTGEYFGHRTSVLLGDGNDVFGVVPQSSGVGTTAKFPKHLNLISGAGDDQVLLTSGTSGKFDLNGGLGNDSLGTSGASLKRRKFQQFENLQLADLNPSLETLYERLEDADIDTTPFRSGNNSLVAPVLTMTSSALTVPENSGPIAIDSQLTLTGTGTTVTGATVQVADAIATQDVLAFTNSGSINGSFNASNGTLTLTGSGSVEQYQAALRSVTYDDLRNPSVAGSRRIDVAVTANAGNASGSRTLNLQGLPGSALNLNDSVLQLSRSSAPMPIDNQLTLTGEGFDVTGATVQVSNATSDDKLAFVNQSGIRGEFNGTTGTLTLTGTASPATYQTALRTITYDNTSSTFTGTRPIQFTVTTARGEVRDTRNVQTLTDQETINNFATANNLTLQRTSSGLNYLIETPGNSTTPTANNSVRVKYRGTLLDGTEFDKNDNALFPLSGVIPGFREGLLLMSEGAVGELFIPSSIGYGEDGTANIPANAVLRFEVELLDVV